MADYGMALRRFSVAAMDESIRLDSNGFLEKLSDKHLITNREKMDLRSMSTYKQKIERVFLILLTKNPEPTYRMLLTILRELSREDIIGIIDELTPVHTSEPEKTEEMPEKQLGEMTVQERLDRIEKKVDDTQREMKKGLKEILNLLSSGGSVASAGCSTGHGKIEKMFAEKMLNVTTKLEKVEEMVEQMKQGTSKKLDDILTQMDEVGKKSSDSECSLEQMKIMNVEQLRATAEIQEKVNEIQDHIDDTRYKMDKVYKKSSEKNGVKAAIMVILAISVGIFAIPVGILAISVGINCFR